MSKYKKKEKKYWPTDYPNFKTIKIFNKPRSPRTRVLTSEDKDGWFIDVLSVKTKTGEVADNQGWILKKQIQGWVDWYKSLGWVENITKN